jgi:hypothetical protein
MLKQNHGPGRKKEATKKRNNNKREEWAVTVIKNDKSTVKVKWAGEDPAY